MEKNRDYSKWYVIILFVLAIAGLILFSSDPELAHADEVRITRAIAGNSFDLSESKSTKRVRPLSLTQASKVTTTLEYVRAVPAGHDTTELASKTDTQAAANSTVAFWKKISRGSSLVISSIIKTEDYVSSVAITCLSDGQVYGWPEFTEDVRDHYQIPAEVQMIVYVPSFAVCGFGGVALANQGWALIGYPWATAHETGHLLFLHHDRTPTYEYGNPYSTMGMPNGSVPLGVPAAPQLIDLGWRQSKELVAGSSISLSPAGLNSGTRAVVIHDGETNWTLEFRLAVGADQERMTWMVSAQPGVVLYKDGYLVQGPIPWHSSVRIGSLNVKVTRVNQTALVQSIP